MAIVNPSKKISQLPVLTSASFNTKIVGDDNNTTYQISVDAISNTVVAKINLSGSVTASIPAGVISSSQQIANLGFLTNTTDIDSYYVQTSSFNSYTASITTGSLLTTSSFNQYTASATASLLNTASFNQYTASISTASLSSSIYNLNSHTSSYLTSLSGAISSSAQVVGILSSLNTYTASVSTASLLTIGAFNSYTQSYSQSVAATDNNQSITITAISNSILGYTPTASFNSFTTSVITNITFNNYTASVTTGSLLTITSFNTYTQSYSQSVALTDSNQNVVITAISNSVLGYTPTASFNSFTTSVVTNTAFNNYTASITTGSLLTISSFNAYTQSYSQSVALTNNNQAVLINSLSGSFVNLSSSVLQINSTTSSFETKGRGIISGSSQLTSSFDIRYAPSASYLTNLSGAISSSIQVLGGSGVFSSSAQINGFELQGRSIISSSAQITAFGFISSSQTIDTGSFATTGSNTFNGNETISGSLFISGTTELGGNIVPKTARGATLGTSDRPFSDIFLSSGSINIASDVSGSPNTSLSNVSGNILISAGGIQLQGTGSFNAVTASFGYLSGSFTHKGTQFNDGDIVTTGSLSVSGSTIMIGNNTMTGNTQLTGSVTISGSTIQIGNNTLQGNTLLSGSISITGPVIFAQSSSIQYLPRVIPDSSPTSSITLDFSKDTLVHVHCTGFSTFTVNVTNFTTGSIVELYLTNNAGTTQVNMPGSISSNNLIGKNGAGSFWSMTRPSGYFKFTCTDGTAANTFVIGLVN